ncbi:MAG: hypothetical protein ACLU3I_09955 [Acutalibacteraceae bacterium]
MDLFSPVTDLRGVGPARAAALQRLGIFTLYDLLAYFPRDYEDRTNPVEIAQLQPGVPACFEALVVSQPVLRRIGKGRDVTNLTRRGRDRQADAALFSTSPTSRTSCTTASAIISTAPAGARDADGESCL